MRALGCAVALLVGCGEGDGLPPSMPSATLLVEDTRITSVAVADGDVVWTTGEGRVMRLRGDGVREILALAPAPSALLAAAGEVYFATGEPEAWVRGVAPGETPRAFASPGAGLFAPTPVAAVGGRLWVVARGADQGWLVAYDLATGRRVSLVGVGELEPFAASEEGLVVAREGEIASVAWETGERRLLLASEHLRVEALVPHAPHLYFIEMGSVYRVRDDGSSEVVDLLASGTYSGFTVAAFAGDDLWVGCDGSGCVLRRYNAAQRDAGYGTSFWTELEPRAVLGEAGSLILLTPLDGWGPSRIYRQPLPG